MHYNDGMVKKLCGINLCDQRLARIIRINKSHAEIYRFTIWTYLSNEFSAGRERETERLRVVIEDVLDTVVELHVNILHVVEGYPLAEEHLVEWTNEEGCIQTHNHYYQCYIVQYQYHIISRMSGCGCVHVYASVTMVYAHQHVQSVLEYRIAGKFGRELNLAGN